MRSGPVGTNGKPAYNHRIWSNQIEYRRLVPPTGSFRPFFTGKSHIQCSSARVACQAFVIHTKPNRALHSTYVFFSISKVSLIVCGPSDVLFCRHLTQCWSPGFCRLLLASVEQGPFIHFRKRSLKLPSSLQHPPILLSQPCYVVAWHTNRHLL